MLAVAVTGKMNMHFLVSIDSNQTLINIAGARTIDGAPVNVSQYRVVSGKSQVREALEQDLKMVTEHEYMGQKFYCAETEG